MSVFYQRSKPGLRENLQAGLVAAGLAAGVAAVSFYLVRLFLAREALEPVGLETSGPGGGSTSGHDQAPE